MKFFASIIFLSIIISCSTTPDPIKSNIDVDLGNVVVQQIFNLQNTRNSKAILPFLTVDNPSHRYVAAMALASVQDSSSIIDLAALLKDEYEEVRYAATYALGLIKNSAAANYLVEAFKIDSSRLVQAAILEAIGRCGTEEHLRHLCVVRPYPTKDSILSEGLALAIYQFALRGMVHVEGTKKIINDFMANPTMSSNGKFIATNYLSRAKGINLNPYENVLINNINEIKNPNTLMFLVTALAKTKTEKAFKTIEKTYYKYSDYRIKCNVLRSLKYFEYDTVKSLAFNALNDNNHHIQITAAEYMFYNGRDKDAPQYFSLANKTQNWQVSSLLLAASLRSTSYFKTQTKLYYSEQIITKYKTSTNSYEKGSLIKALANYSWNYKFIVNELFPRNNKTKTPDIIKSNCAEALVQLRSNPFFGKELGLSKNNISKELNAIFKRCIKQGCVATKAIVAEFYTNPVMNFKKVYKDLGFLKKAQSSLVLPRNIETHIVLEKAIAFLEDRPNNAIKKSTNFTEIDWPLINILKEKKTVIIRTNKGPITLELAPEVAPATVTQFIHLSKAKYYNGKSFHRVVPNFVVQGGCSRGDGWSGFDITVMSEFNYKLDYKDQGYVGMASAGKDTESNQFFITHSPTLHLAGNYTAFAKVRLGMEIVDSIQVGDIIKSIDFK